MAKEVPKKRDLNEVSTENRSPASGVRLRVRAVCGRVTSENFARLLYVSLPDGDTEPQVEQMPLLVKEEVEN